jgi:citrate lyase beta subunit
MHRTADQGRGLEAHPDVIIQDLEDSTPHQLKEMGRRRAASLYAEARRRGVMAAVRINPLETFTSTIENGHVLPTEGPELGVDLLPAVFERSDLSVQRSLA